MYINISKYKNISRSHVWVNPLNTWNVISNNNTIIIWNDLFYNFLLFKICCGDREGVASCYCRTQSGNSPPTRHPYPSPAPTKVFSLRLKMQKIK